MNGHFATMSQFLLTVKINKTYKYFHCELFYKKQMSDPNMTLSSIYLLVVKISLINFFLVFLYVHRNVRCWPNNL